MESFARVVYIKESPKKVIYSDGVFIKWLWKTNKKGVYSWDDEYSGKGVELLMEPSWRRAGLIPTDESEIYKRYVV